MLNKSDLSVLFNILNSNADWSSQYSLNNKIIDDVLLKIIIILAILTITNNQVSLKYLNDDYLILLIFTITAKFYHIHNNQIAFHVFISKSIWLDMSILIDTFSILKFIKSWN